MVACKCSKLRKANGIHSSECCAKPSQFVFANGILCRKCCPKSSQVLFFYLSDRQKFLLRKSCLVEMLPARHRARAKSKIGVNGNNSRKTIAKFWILLNLKEDVCHHLPATWTLSVPISFISTSPVLSSLSVLYPQIILAIRAVQRSEPRNLSKEKRLENSVTFQDVFSQQNCRQLFSQVNSTS